jgi:hypothetical protein
MGFPKPYNKYVYFRAATKKTMANEVNMPQKNSVEEDEDSLKALLMDLFGSHKVQYVNNTVEYVDQKKLDENMSFDEDVLRPQLATSFLILGNLFYNLDELHP